MIMWLTSAFALAVFFAVVGIVQLGFVVAFCILAIVFAAIISAAVALTTWATGGRA